MMGSVPSECFSTDPGFLMHALEINKHFICPLWVWKTASHAVLLPVRILQIKLHTKLHETAYMCCRGKEK